MIGLYHSGCTRWGAMRKREPSEERVKTEPATYGDEFSTCTSCHRDTDGSELREMAPYAEKGTIAGLREPEVEWVALRYRRTGGASGTFSRE